MFAPEHVLEVFFRAFFCEVPNVRCDINSDAYANPLASDTELMDNVQQIWNAAMANDGDWDWDEKKREKTKKLKTIHMRTTI